jgi:hypothetical protein
MVGGRDRRRRDGVARREGLAGRLAPSGPHWGWPPPLALMGGAHRGWGTTFPTTSARQAVVACCGQRSPDPAVSW